jgi:hypothetical protein
MHAMPWADRFLDTLKENDVRLVTYVPDNVLTPLISGATADNYFITVGTTREDEVIGIVAGAWMAGLRGCIMILSPLLTGGKVFKGGSRGDRKRRADAPTGQGMRRRARRVTRI